MCRSNLSAKDNGMKAIRLKHVYKAQEVAWSDGSDASNIHSYCITTPIAPQRVPYDWLTEGETWAWVRDGLHDIRAPSKSGLLQPYVPKKHP